MVEEVVRCRGNLSALHFMGDWQGVVNLSLGQTLVYWNMTVLSSGNASESHSVCCRSFYV